jgi:large subunit ribosomal protein L31
MKAQIHPEWHSESKVVCACGNKFTTGSVMPEIHVEVCSKCHPFYTGQMRFLGGKGRVDKFLNLKQSAASSTGPSKKDRRNAKRLQKMEEELTRPGSLEEIRKNLTK